MSLMETTLFGTIDKEKQAIGRIRMLDPTANGIDDQPYYVAYSGGKDSDVLRILFELSGVKYELHHNHTTADAPETVRYVRSIPKIIIDYPEISMWQLIIKKGFPPTRIVRYCCSVLKENGGMFRFVSTGVRWTESIKRRSRSSLEISGKSRKTAVILNADNTEDRKFVETCTKKSKRVLNPIIDWTDQNVWDFLNYYGCKSNPLYQCGFTRIGCIGCPMARAKKQQWEFARYPKYKEMYIRSFDKMLQVRREKDLSHKMWSTGEDVMAWWLSEKSERIDENQLSLF